MKKKRIIWEIRVFHEFQTLRMPDMLAIDCRDNKVFPKKMFLKLNIF